MLKSLPFKLYAGLIIAVVLVFAVGFVSIHALQQVEEEGVLVMQTSKTLSTLRQSRYDLLQMRGARRIYWATGDNKYMDSWNRGRTTIPNNLQRMMELVASDPELVTDVAKLDSSVSEVITYWNGDGKLLPTQDKATFAAIAVKEEDILQKAYAGFETVKRKIESQLIVREKSLADYNQQTRTVLFIGIGILLIVVLLLINSILQVLKSRYKAGLRLQASHDEIEKTSKIARDKNWTLEGMSYINNRIQGVDSTQMLANNIIKALVDYIELPAGAIYAYNEEEQKLSIVSAVSVGSTSQKAYKLGEGIVGGAALSKTPVLIKHIPPSYWKVDSGLGEITGNGEIMCIPLWVNGELKGLIELGCFDHFTMLQQSFLDNVGDLLAVAINSAQSRDRIAILLEELQDQQEELKQINDELSRQTEELQASEEELRTQEQELKQFNVELTERNKTIEDAKEALGAKAKELEDASRYKSEFLANMSHELRTPLNSILILARLLSDNGEENLSSKQVEYASIIGRSGKDLLTLINDILDLSKIEAGKIEMEIEDVSLTDIRTDLQQLFSVVAAEKQIDFKVTVADDVPDHIQTDKQRLEQVIKNLLANAFKFTPRDGSIAVSIKNKNNFDKQILTISVSDTGIGISEEKQQLIFEAFQQADGSTSRQYGGTGLGLSISKELVRLLGGRIEVFSVEGKGSTFTILLPYEYEMGKIEELPVELELLNAFEKSLEVEIEDDREVLQAGNKIMLIIEDDINFALITRDFAREKGYKTIVALQGDVGLLYAKQYKPSAIILDIQLPVIDGWTLLKKFKADPELKNIPVHIISAFDDNRLKHAGVLAYLKKPIDLAGMEQAFALISEHIRSEVKQILIVADHHFDDDEMHRLFEAKQHQVEIEQVYQVTEADEKIQNGKYDCVIINMGNSISIAAAEKIGAESHAHKIPVIIYLDEDISSEDEMHLKRISDVIVRHSETANSRLIDELEIFLYKMQEVNMKPADKQYATTISDGAFQNKKILLVDDDMRNVFALSAVLEANKMEVVVAGDGRESLDRLKEHTDIDLVLMDIMMPEMDGYEAMRRIRKELSLVDLPIIAVTAKAMTGDRDKCIEAGASDYISKPVDTQKLLSVMRVWLTQ